MCQSKFTFGIGRVAIETVSLSLFRFATPWARLWAFAQMGAARLSLPKTPGIGFWKLLGSGINEGFTPTAIPRVFAILATWPDEATARKQTAEAQTYQRFRQHSSEDWTIFLATTSARGEWSKQAPFRAEAQPAPNAPLAALTRATLKPQKSWRFWKRVPEISDVIGDDPNVLFKIGVGEVPLLHQVTFSIWPDTATMAEFARRDGPHARAIQAVRDEDWFAEELYARFNVLGFSGDWAETDPDLRQMSPMEVTP